MERRYGNHADKHRQLGLVDISERSTKEIKYHYVYFIFYFYLESLA